MISHRGIRRGLAVFAALVLVLLWGGLALYLRHDKLQTLVNANEAGANLSRAFAEHVTSIFRSLDQTLRAVVRDYEQSPATFDAAAEIDKHAVLNDTTFQLSVLSPAGYIALSNLPMPAAPVYVGDREHFLAHTHGDTGRIFISRPVFGRLSHRWSVQVSRRIDKPDGTFGGVALLSLDPQYLSKFYQSIDIGRNGVITVVGLDGIVRARATGTGDTEVGQDLAKAELQPALARAPNGRYETVSPIDGENRLFNYRSLVDYPLVVNVGLARDDVLAEYTQRRDLLISAAAAISIVFAIAAGLLLRQVDLQLLTEAALRRREQELIASRNEATVANRAKSDFLANMSHELRTPLNAIIGFSDLMAGSMLGPIGSPKYLEYATDISRSGNHLLNMISDILDMSKIEAGHYDLVAGDVDVAAVAEFCVRLVAGRAEAGRISMINRLGTDSLKVYTDERALKQILLNLLSNAVKFTPTGGCVTVRAARDGRHDVVLTVSDTGIGIAPDDLDRVGEPFRQVGRGLVRPHEGTGLGLAITKRLVQMLGGQLAIASEPGQGTTVTVRLPAAAAEAPPMREARAR